MTPDNLFRENNEELISMFIDAEVIEATKKEEDENKIVYTKVYKGKIDSYNYYKTALVYFKESKESIWIEINSTPTMMESYSYMVDDIIDSIRETEFE